jgi:hypothetical protein
MIPWRGIQRDRRHEAGDKGVVMRFVDARPASRLMPSHYGNAFIFGDLRVA